MEVATEYFDIRLFDSAWVGPEEYDYDYDGPKEDVYLKIANKMTELIKDGYIISLGVSSEDGGKHATTLWGIETNDETGYLTRMWITDSDDALNGYGTGLIELECGGIENELTLGLGEYEIPLGIQLAYGIKSVGKEYEEAEFRDKKEGRLWYDYTGGRNDYFYDFAAIKMPLVGYQGVPEPATGTLGLLALAGLAARRRRK